MDFPKKLKIFQFVWKFIQKLEIFLFIWNLTKKEEKLTVGKIFYFLPTEGRDGLQAVLHARIITFSFSNFNIFQFIIFQSKTINTEIQYMMT